jgi:hypothetical protein
MVAMYGPDVAHHLYIHTYIHTYMHAVYLRSILGTCPIQMSYIPRTRYHVKNFLFSNSSRLALGSTQPPIQCLPGVLSLGVKRSGVKLTTYLQIVPRSRQCGSIHPLPIRLRGVCGSIHPLPIRLRGVVLN